MSAPSSPTQRTHARNARMHATHACTQRTHARITGVRRAAREPGDADLHGNVPERFVNGGATLRLECKVLNRRRLVQLRIKSTYTRTDPATCTVLQLCGVHVTRWPYFTNDNLAFFRHYIAFPAEIVGDERRFIRVPFMTPRYASLLK